MSKANDATIRTISISGLDGSGKSTQIKLLKKYLESQGKRIFCFHAVNFSVANRFAKFLSAIPEFFLKHGGRKNIRNLDSRFHGNDTSLDSPICARQACPPTADGNDIGFKSVIRANWLQIQLRKIALFIDIWRFKRLTKKLEKQGCDYILSDRFFYDSVVNIEYLENVSDTKYKYKVLSINKIFPMTHTTYCILPFYLQTSPDLIMNRRRVPEQGLEYLKEKKKLYDAKTKIWNWKIINGNKSKEEIFEEIKNLCQGSIS